MLRFVATLALVCFAAATGRADILFSNPITGTNPGLTSPYTTGQTVIANITVSGIVLGAGLTGDPGNDIYDAIGWPFSGGTTDYFSWTLTPNAGRAINFSSFVYNGTQGGVGPPTTFALRSSADGFATNIGAAGADGNISLTAAMFQNRTVATEFRLMATGSFSDGTYGIDDFVFNGTVSAVPEASPLLFGALICSVAAVWRVWKVASTSASHERPAEAAEAIHRE